MDEGVALVRNNAIPIFSAILVASLCLWFGESGLFASFTADDLMNLYKAWRTPLHQILLENVMYFTPGYRPMGSLVYRLLFEMAGLHALPYRIVCFALLLGNLYLFYRTAAAVSTKEAGLLAALFAAYNAGFVDFYYNTGTIYDLLCFTFYFAALGLYIGVRRRGGYLGPRRMAVFLILYVCALNSKEMAVTLPAIVLAYEIVLGRSGRRWLAAVLSALITVPYVLGKFSAASPLMGNDSYRLHLGLRTYLRAFAHYLATLIYLPPDTLNTAAAVLILVLLATIAILARRRSLLFLWLFILITPLPIAFVALRGGYAMYVPSFGIALFLAVVVTRSRQMLARHIAGTGDTVAAQTRRLLRIDTFLLCLVVLFVVHNSRPLPGGGADDARIQSMVAQIASVQPKIGSVKWRVLFLEDPFPQDRYDLLYILRLFYRAPDLAVDRVKRMPVMPDRNAIDSYDCIFSFDGDRLVRIKART